MTTPLRLVVKDVWISAALNFEPSPWPQVWHILDYCCLYTIIPMAHKVFTPIEGDSLVVKVSEYILWSLIHFTVS